jgi:hypothetical protein
MFEFPFKITPTKLRKAQIALDLAFKYLDATYDYPARIHNSKFSKIGYLSDIYPRYLKRILFEEVSPSSGYGKDRLSKGYIVNKQNFNQLTQHLDIKYE